MDSGSERNELMTTQTAFAFDKAVRRPRARRDDPETSREAARSISKEAITEGQEYIQRLISTIGAMTDEEIWIVIDLDIRNQKALKWPEDIPVKTQSGARTRRKELVDMNLLRDSGHRRKTRSGRNAIVWEAV